MIGFVWSMIKMNADVFGRLITVGLNLKFMVQGETAVHGGAMAEHTPAPALPVSAEMVEEQMPFMNLYKMYLVQAGMVVVPIFFIWLITKRGRVEEVQIVLHHREHHSKAHPEEPRVRLSAALHRLR